MNEQKPKHANSAADAQSLLNVGLGIVTFVFLVGCDLRPIPPEKVLSNAQIIVAKDECEKGGMKYNLLSYNGNPAFPYMVVCTEPK